MIVLVVLVAGAMLAMADGGAAAQEPNQSQPHALLDVPYMPQTPELCGGAAVAMVLRYWGERGVFPEDFAPLVGPGDGGILTGVLVSAVRDRGWQGLVVPEVDATARARLRSEVDQGRPLIALIEVGPRTYHYVVIVGSTDQEVVLHDPARAPFRVLRWAEFDRAWAAAGRWLMLVLPPAGFRAGDIASGAASSSSELRTRVPNAEAVIDTTPCRALVARAVDMALAGDREGAEQGLVAASGFCPNDPAPWRELAGLRFSESRWLEARDFALAAVRLAPSDTYGWQLVATSRYLMGDTMGALDAWNRTGEPRVDTVDIHGAVRTRHPVVMRAAELQPRQLLTSDVLRRAERRLAELPVAWSARMKYEPGSELARVDVFIDERPVFPSGWLTLATLGARALVLDDVRVDVAGPQGAGELTSAAWRWSAGRPRVAVSLAWPSLLGLPGITTVDGSWERQSYDSPMAEDDATLVREERRRVGFSVSDWSTSWLRWRAGIALDRVPHDYLAAETGIEVRLAGDRVAAGATGGVWTPIRGTDRFGTSGLFAGWRSTIDPTRASWSARTELRMATRAAPLALWPGAGTGQGRSGLLRAHPLLEDGVLTGQAFGRQLAHASLEHVRPVGRTPAGGLSIAGFVDAARAWRRRAGLGPSRLYVDAGVGLRIHRPGPGGAIRIDLAHGLRGGGLTLSAGWGGEWQW